MNPKEEKKIRFAPAADAIRQLLEERQNTDAPILVAIDGNCGSGKTTLGEYLAQLFDCNLFHMDDFYLRVEQRTPERLEEVGGNVDYERFLATVLKPLQEKRSVVYQPFSCQSMSLMESREIPYKELNLIEGSYSMHPYFRNPYDLRIFLYISPERQMENIRRRNGVEKAKEFEKKWVPKEEAYFEKFQVREGAMGIGWLSENEEDRAYENIGY